METPSSGKTKLAEIDAHLSRALERAGEGSEVVLTGTVPIRLCLEAAHALHGKARKFVYRSPESGEVVIFDHSPD